jgi:hypothetical protein
MATFCPNPSCKRFGGKGFAEKFHLLQHCANSECFNYLQDEEQAWWLDYTGGRVPDAGHSTHAVDETLTVCMQFTVNSDATIGDVKNSLRTMIRQGLDIVGVKNTKVPDDVLVCDVELGKKKQVWALPASSSTASTASGSASSAARSKPY